MKTIDITPSWAAILPALEALLESGSPKARKFAREELRRMAELADKYVQDQKQLNMGL